MSEHCEKCGRDYDDHVMARERIIELQAKLAQSETERSKLAGQVERLQGGVRSMESEIENLRAKLAQAEQENKRLRQGEGR